MPFRLDVPPFVQPQPDLRAPRAEDAVLIKPISITLAATAALALPACGTRSDTDAVSATLHAWAAAVSDGRTHDACAQLTPQRRAQIEDDAILAPQSCEDQVRDLSRAMTPAERREFPQLTVARVAFDARHTKATIDDGDVHFPPDISPLDNGRPTVLAKQPDGRWRIEDLG